MNKELAIQVTYFLLRVVSGLLFMHAGAMKILGWFGGMPPGATMTTQVWIGGSLELYGGILIMLGLHRSLKEVTPSLYLGCLAVRPRVRPERRR